MEFVQVSLSYTYNLGNYESRRLEATVTMSPEENITDVFKELQSELDNENDSLRKGRR